MPIYLFWFAALLLSKPLEKQMWKQKKGRNDNEIEADAVGDKEGSSKGGPEERQALPYKRVLFLENGKETEKEDKDTHQEL